MDHTIFFFLADSEFFNKNIVTSHLTKICLIDSRNRNLAALFTVYNEAMLF